ncbi:hypothetical protein EW026_g2166 [Hermanssonia centrifuga]|uniref:Tat pathway signal sequence n=1 Tax=Hermanssonia centrifuga TaxID=98765 RepID=A0A4S4KP30_9APHY|nr:hypothetical protein EW026_g2166 [Hermanssonia centrifuga]
MDLGIEYKPLLTDPSLDFSDRLDTRRDEGVNATKDRLQRRIRILSSICIAQSLLLLVAAVALVLGRKSNDVVDLSHAQLLYSPAQEALTFEAKKYVADIEDITIYRGEPSNAVDNAWSDLYNAFGVSRISKSEARLLPNQTLAIPGDENHHIISLSVFHELHCLNTIRKALHTEYYTDPITGNLGVIPKAEVPEHISHCIDNIRQALMCASDITPIVWQWSEQKKKAEFRGSVVHSCRSFDRVVEWAEAHQLTTTLNIVYKDMVMM